jgi:hypothetical protein
MVAGKPLTYGAALNNNPTVEDLWNSTPAWGFPWAGPDATPGPIAAALIDGGLAQDALGVGAIVRDRSRGTGRASQGPVLPRSLPG